MLSWWNETKFSYLGDMEVEFENSFDFVFLTPPSEHLRSQATPLHRLSSSCHWSHNPDRFRSPENPRHQPELPKPPVNAAPVVDEEKACWSQSQRFWTQWWSEVTLKRKPVKEGQWVERPPKNRKQTEPVDLISYVMFLSCVFGTVLKKPGDTCI